MRLHRTREGIDRPAAQHLDARQAQGGVAEPREARIDGEADLVAAALGNAHEAVGGLAKGCRDGEAGLAKRTFDERA